MEKDRLPLGRRLDILSVSENLKLREIRRKAWIAGTRYVQAKEQIAGIKLEMAQNTRSFRFALIGYGFVALLLMIFSETSGSLATNTTTLLAGIALMSVAGISLGSYLLIEHRLSNAFEKATRRKAENLTRWSVLTQGLKIAPYLEAFESNLTLDFGPEWQELQHRLISETTGRQDEYFSEKQQ